MTTALAKLPDIESAPLPARYEAAKVALSECSHIDECKAWADKAEAMASYARQAHDDSLRQLADRIQARAIRRCGELLKQIAPARGANQNIGGGDSPKVQTRKDAAREAGLSPDQQKQALRVERVPEDVFETLVESDDPPTITELAEMGTRKHMAEIGRRPGFSLATTAIGTIGRFAEFCLQHDPLLVANGVTPPHVAKLRADVKVIDHWMDRFITNVKE